MKSWPGDLALYEINTGLWRDGVVQKYKSPATLANVPGEEWDAIAELEVDAVWLMGFWERSPEGNATANQHKGLFEDVRCALSDYGQRITWGLLIVWDNTSLTNTWDLSGFSLSILHFPLSPRRALFVNSVEVPPCA